ncbi:two-component system response regulator [Micromonospora sp. ATCC 39149]|uniref:Response regulator transcription factor n=1 Tax=Micromonospora carbonacea TaxID=47853 RepID=A0A7D6CC53_9ACTN|nr:response regulator transcription factor [Micromonospora sp. ATCC 39149]EEP70616.1 two-component system response regulator [Micromonospora sp. ATCC 39149]QLJ96983.1 response regulator transcription factor [Micromonospora carbonacea]
MIRALVVDDQGLVRAGIRVLLDTAPDIEVVGEAADGHNAVRLVERLRPDVVLMDIRMPRVDGIEATRRLLAAAPLTNVLILTTFADDDSVYGALSAGAVGYLVKDGEPADMLDAVRRAARGEPLLAPSVLARVVDRARRSHAADRNGDIEQPDTAVLAALTARERDVLSLVGVGLSNAEIARDLNVGVTTVKTHIVALLEKLGIRNRVQAGILAHRLGLVDEQFRPCRAPAD